MQFIAPDILTEAVGLSPLLSGLGLVTGLLLWLFGWRLHRFWIVLLATVMAGVYGLLRASDYHSQPLLSGILLAIASGLLALALVRVVAFVAGGVAAVLLVQAVAPSWEEPLICFLVGGLLGLILFRVWTMALTSLAGSVLLGYSGLCLAERMGKLKAAPWADRQTLLLNWLCGAMTLVGLVGQLFLERARSRRIRAAEQKAQRKREKEKMARAEPPPPPAPWWRSLGDRILRRAG
jgi:hypothetical protein